MNIRILNERNKMYMNFVLLKCICISKFWMIYKLNRNYILLFSVINNNGFTNENKLILQMFRLNLIDSLFSEPTEMLFNRY